MTFPVLTAALELLREAAANVSTDQLDDPTPCSAWSVAQVLFHAAGDQHGWARVDPDDDAVPTPLPPVPTLAAPLAAAACALDAAVHAWDVAVATGQPSPLSAELAEQLMPAALATADPLRGFAYAAALAPQSGDDAVAALLRYLGRDPAWRP